ncbi:hypothetical protein A2W14_07245 [Candidatus Gottesmanbacteria bacterium RBG_16_37_8]|uniref:Uncharacterized protein n=1 Tax=Candidatus Gottesmanbacteria bacterium RBG_16_37_8 TaxID=1798371 RepID=A0A1F5YSK9_9BACT|nr:MAG: hypothetical protein A2W14_07245 [Candidatus Gottesmanbacteria bacterium RBG_16_37_8]
MADRREAMVPTRVNPQELSTGAVTPELKITSIQTLDRFIGIPLENWDRVKEALYAFASGRPDGSRATEAHNVKAYGEVDGGLGAAMFILGNRQESPSLFVDGMLEEASKQIETRGKWERHYDYDGQGVFHKTTVEIDKIPDENDRYLLKLYAAYVGGKVEDGLAEYLGIEQGLQFKQVSAILEPQGDKFAIDFDAVAKKIQPFYAEFNPEAAPLTGELLLDVILAVDPKDKSTRSFPIGVKKGIDVSFDLGRLGYRINWVNGKPSEDTWSREGNVLKGPLAKDYSDEGGFEAPSVVISIQKVSVDRWDRLPVTDAAMKAEMNEIGSKAVAALS